MRSGQASLEFVLVAAFLLGLITILLPTANNLMDQVSSLADLVVAKGSLNTISSAINYVRISGNGASLHIDVYIPKNMNCFANGLNCTLKVCKEWVSSAQNTYCNKMEILNVSSKSYPGVVRLQNCEGKTGWIPISVSAGAGSVLVSCGIP